MGVFGWFRVVADSFRWFRMVSGGFGRFVVFVVTAVELQYSVLLFLFISM